MVRAPSSQSRRVPWRLRRVVEHFSEGNSVRLLHDGRQVFPAMLAAIEEARAQVLLEMYWFDSGRIGRRFAEALKAAARRGVEVAVIYDAVGSIAADPAMFDDLQRAGAHVLEYNPVAPWKRRFRLARLTRRDHRKILVVDAKLGFTGGVNIGDLWLPEEEEGGGFRDDAAVVEGPAARGFVSCFQRTWRRLGGAPLIPSSSLLAGVQRPQGGQLAQVMGGEGYYRKRHSIARAYLSHIYRAQRRIWIANSYFIPDGNVIRALTRAARRGVDVRILVPRESDVVLTDWASRAVWPRLMRSGVRIFEWTDSILHSKTAVIDGRWSTIGSYNLDYLSLRTNLEVTLNVLDDSFGQTMEAAFELDFARANEVDANTFRFRSLGARLLEIIAYRIRKIL
ncbi:MAG: phospholipase D-like domain-containing protein [Myxococcota bacterium]